MTQKQKLISSDKSVSELLQTIDPSGIADESMRCTVEILLNLVEELNSKVKNLESENERLRDESDVRKQPFKTKSCSITSQA
ncbi:hypothetical protein LC608_09690 [Nostoc sp. XA010]|uniref:hypothetical protein n=1 Tax=Nostoc sp. XA010 TaxID=2780407 RepID=UPI001E60F35A|nr:hypothetical protein [Nostoc sp. XA010]MCC5657249.1 hypothetical protein [Nostoc sp. XA010]